MPLQLERAFTTEDTEDTEETNRTGGERGSCKSGKSLSAEGRRGGSVVGRSSRRGPQRKAELGGKRRRMP